MSKAARHAAALAAFFLISAPSAVCSESLPDAEAEGFLLRADISQRTRLRVGITGSERATLSDGRLTHDAHIQTIDQSRTSFQSKDGTELNFRDTYLYNVAAYRLDRLVNLHLVPVSVVRKVAGKEASVTWWIDDVQMMELERYKKKIKPPNQRDWNDQMNNVRVFNELVYNTDANLGNVLITNDWNVRLIDFTRAFRRHTTLRSPKNLLERIDRRVLDGLVSLNAERIAERLGDVLGKIEQAAILARRDLILAHYNALISQRGEQAVVCSLPGH